MWLFSIGRLKLIHNINFVYYLAPVVHIVVAQKEEVVVVGADGEEEKSWVSCCGSMMRGRWERRVETKVGVNGWISHPSFSSMRILLSWKLDCLTNPFMRILIFL